MTFEQAGATQRWTLGYEEILDVVSGQITINVFTEDESYSVAGVPATSSPSTPDQLWNTPERRPSARSR
jgi:hypothetical protein